MLCNIQLKDDSVIYPPLFVPAALAGRGVDPGRSPVRVFGGRLCE